MGCLGAPVSDDTILRHLKRRVADRNATTPVRVAGIDDWSWRKGSTYGAIVVDLERREVVDVLPDRSAAATANWRLCLKARAGNAAVPATSGRV